LDLHSPAVTAFPLCFLKAQQITNWAVSFFQHQWARQPQAFIISRHCEHLFKHSNIIPSLFSVFLQKQVSPRPSLFIQTCHVSCSPYHACSIVAWIMLNGWLYCFKSGISFSWASTFSFDLVCLSCFNGSDHHIYVVWCMLKLMIWLIFVYGISVHCRSLEMMLNPAVSKPTMSRIFA
jgi:hypothetical protein